MKICVCVREKAAKKKKKKIGVENRTVLNVFLFLKRERSSHPFGLCGREEKRWLVVEEEGLADTRHWLIWLIWWLIWLIWIIWMTWMIWLIWLICWYK